MTATLSILLVDDEPGVRLAVGDALRAAGYDVDTAADGAQALARSEERSYDLVICDILMPEVDGLTVFHRLRRRTPDTDVILITAHGSVNDAVKALKEGATDYNTKPFDTDLLIHEVGRVRERRDLQRQLAEARRALGLRKNPAMIGESPSMRRLFDRVETIAPSDAPVLIRGESGTGKELVARSLHEGSPRRHRPFVVVNCAAFPDTLIEAELFGHERGAFTGAVKQRDGRFKAADGGTLFLDEVAELPPQAQAKLLRVLQDSTFEPLGSNRSIRVSVRVLSATHRNLRERIEQGAFREDLYYRLRVLDIIIPPLRARSGDLPVLVEHFLQRFGGGQPPPPLTERAWAALQGYSFPGNVRELEHAIHHATVLGRGGTIDLCHLPGEIVGEHPDDEDEQAGELRPLSQAVAAFEREYLQRVLERTNWSRTGAAELLGISRKNLWEKMRNHGIRSPEVSEAAE